MMRRVASACPILALFVAVGPAAGRAEMPSATTIAAAGAEFPAVEAGDGDPILFVHGALGDYRTWAPVWDVVTRDHRAIAVTQRYFGTGDWPEDKPFSRDVQDADLVAVIEAIGEPVHLVGYSASGPVVLRAAGLKPELVRSVTIYEPYLSDVLAESEATAPVLQGWFDGMGDVNAALEAGDDAAAARALAEFVFAMPEGGFEALDPARQTLILDNARTVPLMWNQPEPKPERCADLKSIQAPALIVRGTATLPVFVADADVIAGCLPHAEQASIEGVGHGGPADAPDAFAKMLLAFVDAH